MIARLRGRAVAYGPTGLVLDVGGVGTSAKPRMARTIRCTCAFSARPYPQTVLFTVAGGYSEHTRPALAQATSTAPRA